MSVLDRGELEQSPLADLHTIAAELTIDGYRRLRRAELIDAILGTPSETGKPVPRERDPQRAPRGAKRPSSARAAKKEPGPRAGRPAKATAGIDDEADASLGGEEPADEGGQPQTRRRRGRRVVRGRSGGEEQATERADGKRAQDQQPRDSETDQAGDRAEPETVQGTVELLPNGSGFIRVDPPEPSDADVYISAAQIKRCELVSGDRVSGPRRAPRRSERFASLVRVDTINGRSATEVAEGVRFDDLPASFPEARFRLGSEDPTVKAIEWLTPFGRGSRVTIVGAPQAGKTDALRKLSLVLREQEDVQVSLVLAGVRPEEISEWGRGSLAPSAAVSFAASSEAQGQIVERVLDQARRVAARGADAIVLIDTVDHLHPPLARKVMAAARNILDGGSLTVIATASTPVGGETTVIALDVALASSGRFPALDLLLSGTLRPELLVGEAGAQAITRARAQALDG